MAISVSAIYRKDPKLALDLVLEEAEGRACHKSAHLWRSWMGTDGVRYGSYNAVNKQMLVGRKYEIELLDYEVAIYFKDELHDPKTNQKVPISKPAKLPYWEQKCPFCGELGIEASRGIPQKVYCRNDHDWIN